MAYTTDDLIKDVKIRGGIPTSENLFNPERFAALLSDEMLATLIPQILSVNEDYFLAYEDQTIVDGVLTYDMPERSIGMKLKSVFLLDANGKEVQELARITDALSSPSLGFKIQNNQVVLTSKPSNPMLRLYYFRRPNTLVPNIQSGKAVAIDANARTIVLSNVPASWEVGTDLTVVKAKPGFDVKIESTAIISMNAPTIELASVAGIVIGDYVSLVGQSSIPQLPPEAHPVLVQAVVVKCLESLGDANGMAAAQNKLNGLQAGLLQIISPRVDGSPKKIVPKRYLF